MLKHYFGPFEDSMVKIYAVRDKQGNLTGLDVDEGTNDICNCCQNKE